MAHAGSVGGDTALCKTPQKKTHLLTSDYNNNSGPHCIDGGTLRLTCEHVSKPYSTSQTTPVVCHCLYISDSGAMRETIALSPSRSWWSLVNTTKDRSPITRIISDTMTMPPRNRFSVLQGLFLCVKDDNIHQIEMNKNATNNKNYLAVWGDILVM